jgi:hypothetical protein
MSKAKYGIKVGQVYVAADGSRHGLVVVDTETYFNEDDIVVREFSESSSVGRMRRIDGFKLACVRYYRVESFPDWAREIQLPLNFEEKVW